MDGLVVDPTVADQWLTNDNQLRPRVFAVEDEEDEDTDF